MNQLINNTELTMSSREIAELTGKSISHIHRDLKSMFESLYETPNPDLDQVIFEYDTQGRIYLIHLDEEHSINLVTGYNAKLRMAVIKRWKELEKKTIEPSWMKSISPQARVLLDDMQGKIETQNKLIELQAPAVKFVENYTQADSGSKGFRQVAKLLKIKENVFRKFLVDNKIMYLLEGDWTAYANHIDAGRFETKTGEYNNRVCNSVKFTGKGIEWIAGLYEQSKTGKEL